MSGSARHLINVSLGYTLRNRPVAKVVTSTLRFQAI